MLNKNLLDLIKEKAIKEEIYIYGTGQFGKNVALKLRENNVEVSGFIDSNSSLKGSVTLNTLIYCLDEILEKTNFYIVVCSTFYDEITKILDGKGLTNKKYLLVYPNSFNLYQASDYKKKDFINFSQSTIFMSNSTLRMDLVNIPKKRVTIGENSMVDCNLIFESEEGNILIGDNTYIGNNTSLISRTSIMIGDNVTISWGCYIYDHDSHSLNHEQRRKDFLQYRQDYIEIGNAIARKDWEFVSTSPIVIQNDVWIGFEAVILKGVTVGEGSIIASRAVVTKDVHPWSVVAGNPAKVVKYLKKGM